MATDTIYCEGCGKQASQGARFCGGCGRALAAGPPDSGASKTTATGTLAMGVGLEGDPAPQAGRPEAGPETELFDMRPLAVHGFGELTLCVLSLGVAWLVLWLSRRWTRYRITDQRIEVQSGVMDRRRETIELFRVQDFEIREPLFLRLRGAGSLVIRSMDPAEGEIELVAVPRVQEVFEALRTTSISERDRHRVRLLEGME